MTKRALTLSLLLAAALNACGSDAKPGPTASDAAGDAFVQPGFPLPPDGSPSEPGGDDASAADDRDPDAGAPDVAPTGSSDSSTCLPPDRACKDDSDCCQGACLPRGFQSYCS